MKRSLGIVKAINWPDMSSYGVLSEKVDGGHKIWLDAEGQKFFDPYRILALDDEDESLDYLLHKFDEQLNPTGKKWDLNTDGIINIKKGFSFTLIDDEALKISVVPGEAVVGTLNGLSSAVIFLLNLIGVTSSPYEIISIIKGVNQKFDFISNSVKLSAYLEVIKIAEIGSITPEVIDKGNGYASIGLKYTAADEHGNEGESFLLEQSKIDEGTNLLSLGKSQYLRLNPDETKIVSHLQKKEFRNVERAKLPSTAAELIPEGLYTDRFNLADYNPRVVGFAPSSVPKEIGPSSGIKWYKDDEDLGLIIKVPSSNNQTTRLKFESVEDMANDLKVIEEGISELKNDDESKEIKLSNGQVISANKKTLNAFKQEFTKIYRERPPESREKLKKNPNLAAVIEEIEGKRKNALEFEYEQFWNNLKSSLKDGIVLKEHQVVGVKFLYNHYIRNEGGCLIADDMGLGKTIQTLAFLAGIKGIGKKKPILIVSPLILLKNWSNEISKFFKDSVFRAYQLHGDGLAMMKKGQGLDVEALQKHDVILTNYKTLASWQPSLLKLDLAVAIFDESQNIKNPKTSTASAARGLKTGFVICLTGTPVENRLLDLWPQVSALQRITHPLGSDIGKFTETYEKSPEGVQSIKKALGYPGDNSIVIRREKSEVTSLKPLNIITEYIPMSIEQVEDEQNIVNAFKGKSLEILQNLQSLYQHPVLRKKQRITGLNSKQLIASSPKLEWLVSKLSKIKENGEKVLVFTLWRAMQDLISNVLEQELDVTARLINGETNSRDPASADQTIERFSETAGFDIIIASPIAAGAGLNITAATNVIHYGRWWNPAKEDQATCRAYRIGQEREVTVYYPILHHPEARELGFDVKLNELVEQKRKLAADFLNPSGSDLTETDAKKIFGESK